MADEDDMDSIEAQELLEMEIDRLRAENERLRSELAAERERCAVVAEESACDCCCTPDEKAMAEWIANKIREPNADVTGLAPRDDDK